MDEFYGGAIGRSSGSNTLSGHRGDDADGDNGARILFIDEIDARTVDREDEFGGRPEDSHDASRAHGWRRNGQRRKSPAMILVGDEADDREEEEEGASVDGAGGDESSAGVGAALRRPGRDRD